MDPFTQRMLEKAEQRSRALGISNASKFPLTECSGVNVASASCSSGGDAGLTMLTSQKQQQQQKIKEQQQQQLLPLRSSAQSTTTTHASTNTVASTLNKLQVVEKKPTMMDGSSTGSGAVSPNKVLRQFSAVDKENMDLGIEINIMTDKNIEVQVQVEEQELTDDDEGYPLLKQQNQRPQVEAINQPLARLRDTSRNRLQRLGALYSETADLSSPIHRTEGKFSAEDPDETAATAKKTKQRYGKLATLAHTINEWEDDTSHHTLQTTHATTVVSEVPPRKPDLPSRRLGQKKQPAPPPPTSTMITDTAAKPLLATKKVDNAERTLSSDSGDSVNSGASIKTKQLKWDPKVINSLEAQGFQRRESNTAKLAYEYEKTDAGQDFNSELKQIEKPAVASNKPSNVSRVGKLPHAEIFNVAQEESSSSSFANPAVAEKKIPNVKSGLVSGRAAVFEHKAAVSQQQRSQKDPTELSLKERMQLFEKNKGEALLPKAAFGMAPSINKIRQEAAAAAATAKRDALKAPSPSVSTSSLASIKANADNNVREKVAALVASATTISGNKIKADINKQRQEDMQVLANRFNKQKDVFVEEHEEKSSFEMQKVQTCQPKKSNVKAKAVASPLSGGSNYVRPPPPPPPPPPSPMNAGLTKINTLTTKRRSPGDVIDEETKRAKKSNTNRLYPALSHIESNEEEDSYSDNDNCCSTTATPPHSGRATADDELRDQDENNCNESYVDSEDSTAGLGTGSLGREVLQAVTKNDKQQQNRGQNKHNKEVHYAEKDYYYGDSSINSSEEASMGVDDYLDEALDDDHIENNEDDGDDDFTQSDEDAANASRASRGSKGTTASNSFSFRKTPRKISNCLPISEEHDDYRTPTTSVSAYASTQPVKSELSVNQEDENMVTLVHTVSFYRRQQTANSNNNTPVRKICREQQVLRSTPLGGATANFQYDSHQNNNYTEEDEDSQSETDSIDDSHMVQEKIKKLIDEVCKQQQVIGQTSQALNLCAATIEFSGSTESVEGERHLLVASHRRQACLDEVQRLRVEKSLRPIGAPKEKGRLTVKDITVPLRQDYIRKLAADTISGHHLVCLLRYNEHVLATKTVPTLPGLLAVKFPDVLQLNNVYADFRITLEIYGMTAQREVLPHEVKYHINLNKKSGNKTPKKKGSDNRLIMPPVQSPAGPNVVRTPALVQYGFAIFSLREIQRTTWTLTQVLGVSPLDGAVHMKVNCELSVSVEYKGFLTMFEDISGFGAWHRRWCHLNGTMLNYWKYPDDEKKKTPMGSIDLYTCCTQKVTTAPRDICARLNTMLLECQRLAKDTDQESLIMVPNGRMTIVRHLLSADTKEEREEWCAYFNKALTLLRAWGPPQC